MLKSVINEYSKRVITGKKVKSVLMKNNAALKFMVIALGMGSFSANAQGYMNAQISRPMQKYQKVKSLVTQLQAKFQELAIATNNEFDVSAVQEQLAQLLLLIGHEALREQLAAIASALLTLQASLQETHDPQKVDEIKRFLKATSEQLQEMQQKFSVVKV